MLKNVLLFFHSTALRLMILNSKTHSRCPVQIIPWRAVVRYGDSVSADCKTSVLHKGMGWEASEGAVPMTKNQNLITWRVSELTEWDIKPFCYINYKIGDEDQCQEELPVTVYKTPDSVFISVNHSGPMKEREPYELQCDVHNVAPVQDLTVKWYKRQTLLHQTTFTDTSETPVNETVTLLIRPDRADDGAQYRCEAELDLGAEGPQPHPTISSKPLSITVYYAPVFYDSQEKFVVGEDSNITLECYSTGNPEPEVWWSFKNRNISTGRRHINIERATSTSAGVYTCSATNKFGRSDKTFIVEITGLGCECENSMI
uniref:Ig-like domain-containing protein n=1 Tax=Sinocyclocheilus grahami TaxID=75366 RepID=A0A672MFZ9_SINGR